MAHTFNGEQKRIYIDPALPNVSVKGLYSDWKEWAILGNNLGFAPAFRTFGGDPTVSGQFAPAYYFLTNGWRLVVDGFDADFSYNLYTDEGVSPVITVNEGTAKLNNSDSPTVTTSGGSGSDLTVQQITAGLRPLLETINDGVKKASLLVPHNTDL